jgi:hypothetical protein
VGACTAAEIWPLPDKRLLHYGVVGGEYDASSVPPESARHNIMTANPARFYKIEA